MSLKMRKDVPVELTWDLSLLYPTEEAMLEDLTRAKEASALLVKQYKGKLTDPQSIVSCLDQMEQILIPLFQCSNYASLGASVDFYDTHAQELDRKVDHDFSEVYSQLTFVKSEILACDEKVIADAIDLAVGCKHYLEDLLRLKPHYLSPETEKVLATLNPVMGTPYQVYNASKLADMKFDSFTVAGREYPLGYSLFEDDYSYHHDPAVRRAAFAAFSEKIRQYENTNATIFNANAMQDKLMSKIRGYDNVFDYLLFEQKVPREMYDRQIDLITEHLAPHMQKYARLLQKVHGLDRMTYADLKIPLDPDFTPELTLDQAKEYCMKGLSILGDDYVAMVKDAFEQRWFDLARNQGKSTGGFCSPIYRKNSYILLSWNGRMSDVLTMAHELGHAGHGKLSSAAQSMNDAEISYYLGEAPSTMNELLMAHYLLKTSDDKRFRRWVISCMVGNTYYHNFVTHLREAWFQREVYRIIDKGGSVNAEVLNDLFRKNLEVFWGDAVELVDGCELTWMRQPHYYMGLYPYTYSAGLTLATQVCKRIETEGAPAVEDWKKMLSAGSTLDPIALAKLAGVDITSEAALLDTIDYIGELIDELCEM